MSKSQLIKAYENKEEFIEGEWEEEWPDEHDWRESLPYGYSSDGVRVRSCKECGMSLVFNLDSQKRPYIESFGDSDYECNFKYEGDEDEDYGAESFGADESDLSMTLANMERELGINSEDYEDYGKYPNPIARLNAAISKIEREFDVNEEDFQHRGLKKDAESFGADNMDFKEAAKTGFGIAAGFTLFKISLLGVAAVAGIVLSRKE